ncbi:MAG: hypothetical protein LBS74_09350 [Oscillospiraceae bacterium]|jgi:hypothetical protein|nr:hypothetical protein [Oscillospiraceae bacterium]
MNMNIKKNALILALLMLVCLAGCKKPAGTSSQQSEAPALNLEFLKDKLSISNEGLEGSMDAEIISQLELYIRATEPAAANADRIDCGLYNAAISAIVESNSYTKAYIYTADFNGFQKVTELDLQSGAIVRDIEHCNAIDENTLEIKLSVSDYSLIDDVASEPTVEAQILRFIRKDSKWSAA